MPQTLEEKLIQAVLRYPDRRNSAIAKNFKGATSEMVQRARAKAGCDRPSPPKSSPDNGIPLRGMRVLARRPADNAGKFIKRLPAGRGFEPAALSREWGMSEETIRKHARELGCLKYVEVREDEWVQLVMNPETAHAYS